MKKIFTLASQALLTSALFMSIGALAASSQLDGWGLETEAEQPAPTQRSDYDFMHHLLAALVAEVEPQQLIQLPLEDSSFLALYLPALSAQPKGQVLLLPGEGQHPNWPEGLAPLRQGLPEYGWSSLALALPSYTATGIASRTLGPGPLLSRLDNRANTKSTEAVATNSDLDPFTNLDPSAEEATVNPNPINPQADLEQQQTAVTLRLEAALDYLASLTPSKLPAHKQVLVLQGASAYWVQPWLAAGGLAKSSPLILLYLEEPSGADAASFSQLLHSLGSRPILDIYAANNAQQAQLAAQRQAAYLRAGNKQALQLQVNLPLGSQDVSYSRWLTQRVEGWLRRL